MNKNNLRVKIGLMQQVQRGKCVGKAPVGYKHAIVNNERILIHDEKSSLVKEAFDLYSTGLYSVSYVSSRMQNKYAVPMGRSSLHLIFRNPFYYGEMLYNGKLYPHNYEPIITKDLFDKVQSILASRATGHIKSHELKPFIYRMLLSCYACHRFLSGEIKKKKYKYYSCKSNLHTSTSIREESINEALKLIFSIYNISDEVFDSPSKMKLIFNILIERAVLDSHNKIQIHLKKGIESQTIYELSSFIMSGKAVSDSPKEPDKKLTFGDPILSLCLTPRSLEYLIEEVGLDISQLQSKLLDLQLEGLIDEDESGKWKTI